MLAGAYRVRIQRAWEGGDDALMIALHARRSADSIAAWRAQRPQRPLVVVLTGTDLYRDIAHDVHAKASVHAADRLIVLNELGAQQLPRELRSRSRVMLQSCSGYRPAIKTRRRLRALMVGHLREEKSPQTYFEAALLLAGRADIVLDHVGAALDPALGAAAKALMRTCPQYRWLGALPHAAARARIRAAHVLVHPSLLEGGAHVIIEAVRSATPVLASCVDGNVGLLGADYRGYFPVRDAGALAKLLERARDEPRTLSALRAQCAARAALFSPGREQDGLRALVRELLDRKPFDGAQ